jgi:hypothetical protein
MESVDTAKNSEYTKPAITDHGSLTELTAGFGSGTHLDATFPTGTKKTKLTFSGP